MTDSSTILLVDDDEAVRKVLSFPLERDGYEVILAADGEEALRRFDESAVDLVVLDIMLPKLDGLEVCKQLRARSSVPIIMLTARDDELDKVLGLELGADDYVTKPFSIREFRSRTRALLRRARAPRHEPDGGDGQIISADGLVIDVPTARRRGRRAERPAHVRRVRASGSARRAARPGLLAPDAARGALGKRRVPRPAHDRRARAASPREARARLAEPGVHPHRAQRRVPLPGPVNPLRTVGGRLALALLVVVGGALAIVYLIVVSSYRSSLVNTRLKDMSHTVALIAAKPRPAPGEVFPSAEWIEDEALPVAGGARVAIFSAALGEPVADSNGGTSVDIEHDPLVRRAERSQGIVSSAVDRDGSTYAEAAVALKGGSVLFVSSPLHSDLTSLSVVRRRVLLAMIAATAFAIVLGYGLATLFARRIRRLEAAAERIADGRFDEPVLDDSAPDELGQLARAFEQMRLRLASLDRARGEFIANASHELRTPLFSLAGFLELLDTDENVDAETREEFLASMRVQVRAADEARERPARSLTDGCGPAGGLRRGLRSRRGRRGARDRVRAARRGRRPRTRAARRPTARITRGRRDARAPDRPHPDRQRRRPHAARHAPSRSPSAQSGGTRGTRRRGRRARDSRRVQRRPSSTASTGSTGRSPRAAGSAWRSPGSSPS